MWEAFLSILVWYGIVALLKKNREDLERVQKSAVRIIIGKNYESYEDGLEKQD